MCFETRARGNLRHVFVPSVRGRVRRERGGGGQGQHGQTRTHATLLLILLTIAPLFPAGPIRRRACPRMEVGSFMASPFFRCSGGEEILRQSAFDYEEKAKEGVVPPSRAPVPKCSGR